jgi:hypothetical protein
MSEVANTDIRRRRPSGLTFLRIDDRRVIGIAGDLLVAKQHLSPMLQFVLRSI